MRLQKKYEKELSHRHFLGTILSLGIKREKIGDILTGDAVSYVFVSSDIADFIKDNITKIAGCGVDIKICNFDKVKVPKKSFEYVETVSASMRLDATLAAMLKISRGDAKAFILSGKVMVNHIERQNVDFNLDEGDLLSIRGFGRAEVFKIGNKTRSDRVHITIKKYI